MVELEGLEGAHVNPQNGVSYVGANDAYSNINPVAPPANAEYLGDQSGGPVEPWKVGEPRGTMLDDMVFGLRVTSQVIGEEQVKVILGSDNFQIHGDGVIKDVVPVNEDGVMMPMFGGYPSIEASEYEPGKYRYSVNIEYDYRGMAVGYKQESNIQGGAGIFEYVSYGGVSNRLVKVATSRINIANGVTRFTPLRASGHPVSAGWSHVVRRHFYREIGGSTSVFTASEAEVKAILQSKTVVNSPVRSLGGGQYAREVNTGQIIGRVGTKYGGGQTSSIQVITDFKGNLITTYPIPTVR